MLVVGANHEVIATPAIDHARRFGLHDGVDTTDLVADLPCEFEEEGGLIEVWKVHGPQGLLRLLRNYHKDTASVDYPMSKKRIKKGF